MKTFIQLTAMGAIAALFAACDAQVNTTPPVVEKNTTIVNPPKEEKKVETNTTIINPPAASEKKD